MQVGSVLLARYGGEAAQLIAAAGGSAVQLVDLVVDAFSGFRDCAMYRCVYTEQKFPWS